MTFEKISNLTQLFKKTFEYSPVSFRAGRFGIGSNSLLILNKLGYLVDSSIYPFSIIQTKEKSYNFCYYPIQPYFPDLRDPSQTALKESETILEVPLTIRSKFFQSLPSRIGRKISDSSLLTGLLSKVLGKNYVKTFSLRPSTNSYKLLLNIADFHIRNVKRSQDVYLNLMFHSNEIIEGASPYCQTESEIELFLRNLNLFFSHIKKNNIKFIKLKDTYFLFKEQVGENNV
ncbi:hypothetical protein JNL27_14750 [bacterium]|nr:hypothetical protein [bacterium]